MAQFLNFSATPPWMRATFSTGVPLLTRVAFHPLLATNLELPAGVRGSCRGLTMATTEPSTSANTRDSARCSGRLRSSRFRPRKSEREGTRRPFPATRCWYRSTPRWHRCWRLILCQTISRGLKEGVLKRNLQKFVTRPSSFHCILIIFFLLRYHF